MPFFCLFFFFKETLLRQLILETAPRRESQYTSGEAVITFQRCFLPISVSTFWATKSRSGFFLETSEQAFHRWRWSLVALYGPSDWELEDEKGKRCGKVCSGDFERLRSISIFIANTLCSPNFWSSPQKAQRRGKICFILAQSSLPHPALVSLPRKMGRMIICLSAREGNPAFLPILHLRMARPLQSKGESKQY